MDSEFGKGLRFIFLFLLYFIFDGGKVIGGDRVIGEMF